MKKGIQSVLVAAVVMTASACSTVGVIVPVTKPAEINLKGKNEIIVNDIVPANPANPHLVQGGQILADMVRERLAESNFTIIDRNHLGSVMMELQLGASDLASPEGQAKLGKLMTGSVMVSGRMDNYEAGSDVTAEKRKCTRYEDGQEIVYPCVVYTRKAFSNVRASFNVIDIQSAQNLKTKVLTCKNTASTQATDAEPDDIDLDALREECALKVAADFAKVIAPWTQRVEAFFQKDGSLPTLEIGIKYAQAGDWNSAIANFQKAIDESASNPDIKVKAAGKAYWNMGLALEFTGKFDEAAKHVKKAYELTNDGDYLSELDNIKRMKADQAKLDQQLQDAGSSPAQQ
ncbi:hypothetical protein KBA39_08340 [Myxococcota bacterium]|nr:hypothetical protein [Myxococcota bacterium]